MPFFCEHGTRFSGPNPTIITLLDHIMVEWLKPLTQQKQTLKKKQKKTLDNKI
ncbi:MAG: hypothetical protein [Microvirus sp.]|nr:MAG: hypothetical protein [Microvirus sp.]